MLNYRPDIDGLRAIAVLLAIFCHAQISFFAGGYVGVDIFFVISGYLITRIILQDLATNQFSFGEFYLKRARRILPALAVMVFVTACLNYFLAMPQHLDSLSGALFAVCFFVSNIFFQYESADYFGQTTLAFQPLLHTWSLGVEEQFYLVFPILLFALWRFGKVADWIARIGFMSLVVSLLLTASSPAWAFYSLPSRFWEMLLGGYLATALVPNGQVKKLQLGAATSTVLSSIGIVLISASTIFYTQKTPFPGLAALAPCVGAALLIWTGSVRPTLLHRLLGSAPFRTIGALSYSLYLWHWPIRVYCQSPLLYYYFDRNLGLYAQFVLTAGISWLSWRYVETPMRALTLPQFTQRRVIAGGASLGLAVLTIAYAYRVQALRFPLTELQALFTEKPSYMKWDGSDDFIETRKTGGGRKLGATSKEPNFILLGDSYATMWASAVDKLAREKGIAGTLVAKTGCPVLRNIKNISPRCALHADARIDWVKESPIKTIIIAQNWRRPALMGDDYMGTTMLAAADATLGELREAGKTLYVVHVPPGSYVGPYQDAALSLHNGKRSVYNRTPTWLGDKRIRHLEILSDLQKKYGFTTLDPYTKICDDNGCLVAVEGKPLYSDKIHLSEFGADYAIAIFSKVLETSP